MYCTSCGKEIPEQGRFCPYCGEPVSNVPVPSDDPWEQPDSGWMDDADVPVEAASGDFEAPFDDNDLSNPKLRRSIYAALGVVAVALVSLLVVIATSGRRGGEPQTASVPPSATVSAEASARPGTAPTPAPTASPAADGYLLPDSASRKLTETDLSGLTWEQCCLARNEIFARHGRQFATPAIAAYFQSKRWYSGSVPADSFRTDTLNEYEHYNAELLTQYENSRWGHSYY